MFISKQADIQMYHLSRFYCSFSILTSAQKVVFIFTCAHWIWLVCQQNYTWTQSDFISSLTLSVEQMFQVIIHHCRWQIRQIKEILRFYLILAQAWLTCLMYEGMIRTESHFCFHFSLNTTRRGHRVMKTPWCIIDFLHIVYLGYFKCTLSLSGSFLFLKSSFDFK